MRNKKILSFILYSLVYIFLILLFISLLVFGFNIDGNYYKHVTLGFYFLIINILISFSLLIYNIISFVKETKYYYFDDEDKDLRGKAFAIYLISFYLISALFALIF